MNRSQPFLESRFSLQFASRLGNVTPAIIIIRASPIFWMKLAPCSRRSLLPDQHRSLVWCWARNRFRSHFHRQTHSSAHRDFPLDTLKEERWQRDRDNFVKKAADLGVDVKVQSANGDDVRPNFGRPKLLSPRELMSSSLRRTMGMRWRKQCGSHMTPGSRFCPTTGSSGTAISIST